MKAETGSAVPAAGNTATVRLALGPLVGPVLARVVGMVAVRAACPVDRLDDALLIADAVAAHSAPFVANGRLGVEVTAERERGLELRVGPLRSQGARELIAAAALPGVGNVLERAADAVAVEPASNGDAELLVLRVGFAAPARA